MKKLILTLALCFTGWGIMAMPGGTRIKSVQDLGKGLQKVTWFYDNGKIAEEGFYFEGEKHGTWTSFDENGLKTSSATWSRDKKDGDCFVMHANGKIKYHIVYSENKKVIACEWDENGIKLR